MAARKKKPLNLKRPTGKIPPRKKVKPQKVWRTNIMPTKLQCQKRRCRNLIQWNKAWASDKGLFCSKKCAGGEL
jgi:hypothetical protein